MPAASVTRYGAGGCARAASTGWMYLWPNNPSNVAEPGLFAAGGVSVTAPAASVQAVSPSPQWTASPMNALVGFAKPPRSGVPPKTVGMSPVFSSTMFAVENSPTEQPARVNGTHGSGAVCPGAPSAAGTVGE